MKESAYMIETNESGRYIVWRITEDNKYRQGSHDTYNQAFEAMSNMMTIMGR